MGHFKRHVLAQVYFHPRENDKADEHHHKIQRPYAQNSSHIKCANSNPADELALIKQQIRYEKPT